MEKKNKKDAAAAPIQKKYFSIIKKFFEKFPKKIQYLNKRVDLKK